MKTTENQTVGHTPAPWQFKQHEMDCEIFSDDWGPIAATKGGHCTKSERLCNARLIIAAPDFQAATAYLILNDFKKGGFWPEEMLVWAADQMKSEKRTGGEIAQTAIAKATGGAR